MPAEPATAAAAGPNSAPASRAALIAPAALRALCNPGRGTSTSPSGRPWSSRSKRTDVRPPTTSTIRMSAAELVP